jgi:hypothetical protein
MHPHLTDGVRAAVLQQMLRDAERSRLAAAARGGSSPPETTRPRAHLFCWLRDRWRRHVDLTSPWGPISASRPSGA